MKSAPVQKGEAECGVASATLRCAATLPVERSTLSSWCGRFRFCHAFGSGVT
jgi:hypothetical protein